MKLFHTLQQGVKQLGKDAQERVGDFVRSQHTENESFMDKSGKPDLYYTVFGWMLAYIMGVKIDIKRAGDYLESLHVQELDLIHYAAYMRCRLICRLFESGKAGLLLKSFFAEDIRSPEDFNSMPHNDRQSPYTQFISLSLLEDTGHRVRNKQQIVESLEQYRADKGGFMNIPDGLTATTNATVAALAVKGQLEGYNDNAAIRYLQNLQQTSGGFSAAQAAPLPDLLSTATALFMLKCYGIRPIYPAKDFIEAHWLDLGSFAATLLDEKSDVEYTFYGLLALGAVNK